MKILLTGSSGMLGSECEAVLTDDYKIIAPKKDEFDITNWDQVTTDVNQFSPDIILNCAGFTKVDDCETERMLCERINVEGTRNLAQVASRYEKIIVHISSNFVFNGKKKLPQPYFEDDPMAPISFYGLTKMESEMAVKQNSKKYIIIRTGWLYSIRGRNFLKDVLKAALKNNNEPIKVEDDQLGSPTWAHSLALQIKTLIDNKKEGTYHATSEGYCSRYTWAKYVFDKMGIKTPILPCSSKDYPRPAARPLNSILENRQLKTEGFNIMVPWERDLDAFIEKYGDELLNTLDQSRA